MGPMNDFNLQQFLQDMRDEQKTDHLELSKKVEEALKVQSDHTTRITLLERFRSNTVKAGWLSFGAFVVFVFDLVKNHLLSGGVKP
jgi:hypothetical protein